MGNYAYELYIQAQNYRYGWNGVKKDIKIAIILYKKSAEAGYKPALDRLKELETEIKQKQLEEKQIFNEILTSARTGNTKDMYAIGFAYEFGKYGLSVNNKEACNWYRMAAQRGYVYADYRLKVLEGQLKAENEDELRKKFYEKGYCYEHGVGVKIDKTFAIEMYEKAAAMGYDPAIETLERINNNASYEQNHQKKREDNVMQSSKGNQTKFSKVNYSKAVVVVKEKQLDIKQLLQTQLYLKIHPVLKEDGVCKLEYMALLETVLTDYVKRDQWKKSLIELYKKYFVNDLADYKQLKSKMVFPKYYQMKSFLLTDSLFIGAFADKSAGFEILKQIAKIHGNRDDMDEYIFKSFYSEDPVLNFDKKFPELFDIYRAIWHNRLFLKKPVIKIMITANMSAGKSTLLNALAGKKVTKTQNDVCTAKRHYLYNKAGEDGFNYELDHDLELDASEEILMTDNEKNKSEEICVGTRFFTAADLNQRICFIDTPGANSSQDSEHREITERVIIDEKCDLLIFLLNAENIGTDDDYQHLSFVKKNYSGRIIFLINKLDHFKQDVDSVKETLTKAKSDIEKVGFKNVEVYPVSAYAAYLAKLKLRGEKLNEDEQDELDYLTRKLSKNEFNYGKYFQVDLEENNYSNRNDKTIYQLLFHSGIICLEKLIYK